MIVFELTFPNRGSWNGKWSGEKDKHIIVKKDYQVPKDRIGKSYYYDFGDGWGASISVQRMVMIKNIVGLKRKMQDSVVMIG